MKKLMVAVVVAAVGAVAFADAWSYSDHLVDDITIPVGGTFDVWLTKATNEVLTVTSKTEEGQYDLVPCERYGEIGFWDKVSERFLRMRGTTVANPIRATTSTSVGPTPFAGTTRTWTGGGTGGWGDSTNWGGETPPGSGEKAIIPAGDPVSIADADVSRVAGLAEIEIQTGGKVTFANTSTALALSAKLVGGGSILAENSKGITLSGSNEWFYGPTFFSNTAVTVTSHLGLGCPSRPVEHWYQRLLFKGAGLTNEVPLRIVGNRNAATTQFSENLTDKLVFNGAVVFPKTIQIWFGDWSFNDGITFVGSMYSASVSGNCHTVLRGRSMNCDSSSYSTYFPISFGGNATFEFAATGTKCKDFAYTTARGSKTQGVVCGCTNALSTTQTFHLGKGSVLDGSLNLNGYDQTIPMLRYSTYEASWTCTPTPGAPGYGLVFSDEKPAVLTMTGSTSTKEWTVAYKFSGKVSLVKQGKETYRIVNHYSDTTGKLRVEDGAVAFDWSAGWGGDVEVAGGAVRFLEGAYLNTDGKARVSVAEGAKLYVTNGVAISCASLKLGEEQLGFGRYTAADYPDFIEGEGEIAVLSASETYTWTGAKGDGNILDGENWQGGTAPIFAGSDKLLFVSGAQGLTVNWPEGTYHVNSVEVTGEGSVSFSGTGRLCPGANGLHIAPTDVAQPLTVTIAAPITLDAATTEWYVGEGATLEISGDISGGMISGVLSLTGLGTKILSGDNEQLLSQIAQVSTGTSAGKLYLRTGTALGSPLRDSSLASNAARFDFTGTMTNVAPIVIDGAYSNWPLKADDGSTLVQKGAIKITTAVPTPLFTSTWIWLGGFTALGGNCWFQGGGDVYVRETPIDVTRSTTYFVTGGTLYIATTNNIIPRWHLSGSAVCEATNILSVASTLALGTATHNGGGTLDLNGFDQDLAGITVHSSVVTSEAYDRTGRVKSATPAVLRVNGTKTTETYLPWKFSGQASFEWANTKTIKLLNAVSDTSGYLKVSDGRLEIIHGAGFTNASAVAVSGGTLFVRADSAEKAFGCAANCSRAAMTLSGDGQLELDAGGTATVRKLFVGGEQLLRGYYGSTSCTDSRVPTENKLACLTGTGVLRVLSGGGCVMIVR